MTEKNLLGLTEGMNSKKTLKLLSTKLKRLKMISNHFGSRSLCCIKLSSLINDRAVEMRLESDEWGECIELVLQKRVERLKRLRNEFKRL